MFRKNKALLTALLFFVLGSTSAFASEVLQIKGTKALLGVSDISVYPGTVVFGVDGAGKRRALMTITQVRGDKAIAEVTKGTAQVGMTLRVKEVPASQPKEMATSQAPTEEAPVEKEPARSARPRGFFGQFLKRGTAVGLTAGLSQNSMSLTGKKNSVTEDLTLKGNSYNFLGFYDYDMSKYFTVRAAAGLESFSVSGTSNSGICSSSECSVAFNYLAGEAHAHYNFIPGRTRVWAGVGAIILLTMSKSSTVPNLDTSGATNQLLTLEAGSDIEVDKGSFVPISMEYGIYPGSSVKADSLIFRAGYGWRF